MTFRCPYCKEEFLKRTPFWAHLKSQHQLTAKDVLNELQNFQSNLSRWLEENEAKAISGDELNNNQ